MIPRLFQSLCLFAAFLALLVVTQHCDGTEPLHLTISEPFSGILPVPYLPEVYNMTPVEFYKWATNQNAEELAAWEKWYETAPPRWARYDETSTSSGHDGVQPGYRGSRGYGERHSTQTHYQRRYLNPDYVSRPLTIINPFCPPKK